MLYNVFYIQNNNYNNMTISEANYTIDLYCKIPFTETTGTFKIKNSLTTSQLVEYINTQVRDKFNIHNNYYIEVIEVESGELGIPIEANNELLRCQGYRNVNDYFVCYVRPVNPTTREFVRKNDYTFYDF